TPRKRCRSRPPVSGAGGPRGPAHGLLVLERRWVHFCIRLGIVIGGPMFRATGGFVLVRHAPVDFSSVAVGRVGAHDRAPWPINHRTLSSFRLDAARAIFPNLAN